MADEVKFKITLDDTDFKRGMGDAASSFSKLGESALSGGSVMSGAIGGAAALMADKAIGAIQGITRTLQELVVDAGKAAEAIQNFGLRTGFSAEQTQIFQLAAKEAGVSMGAVASAATMMEAKLGAGSAAFAKLGLNAAQLRQMDPGVAFQTIAEKLAGMTNQFEKAAVAREIFGRGGAASILPFVNAMQGAEDRARAMNVVLGDDSVKALANMDDQLDDLDASWEGLKNQVAAVIVQDTSLIQNLKDIITVLGAVSRGFEAAGPAIDGFGDKVARFPALLAGPAGVLALLHELAKTLGGMPKGKDIALPIGGGGTDWRAMSRDWAESLKKREAAEKAAAAAAKARAQSQAELERGVIRLFNESVEAIKEQEQAVGEAQRAIDAMFASSTVGLLANKEANTVAVSGFDMRLALARQEIIQQKERASEEERIKKILQEEGLVAKDTGIEWMKLAETAAQLAGIFNAIGGFLDAIGVSSDSALGKLTAGLEGIAKAGANLGSAIASGNPLAIIGAGFGAAGAIVDLGKSIFDLFTSSPAEKAAKEAGRVLGMKFTEEMGQQIVDQAKKLGISVSDAILLNITAAAEASGRAISSFMPQLSELMEKVAAGVIPAVEGVEELGKAFTSLQEEGGRAMVQMIQQARELGLAIPEIAAAIKESLGKAITALPTVLENINLSGENAALLFSATFWAVFKEQGIAGIEAMAPAWEALQARLEELGVDATAILGQIPELMSLMGEATKPVLEGVQALDEVLKGLGDSGYMTLGSFQAMQQGAQAAFDQLVAGGASSSAAFAAIAPLLADLQKYAEMYGIELDANTQKLIDQAKEAGVAFPTDPLQKVISLLEQLVVLMGGTLPDAADKAGRAFERAGDQAVAAGNAVAEAWMMAGAVSETGGITGKKGQNKGIPDVTAQSGFYSESMPWGAGPGGMSTIGVHPNERVSIEPAGADGGTMVFPIYIAGTKVDEYIIRRQKAGYFKVG